MKHKNRKQSSADSPSLRPLQPSAALCGLGFEDHFNEENAEGRRGQQKRLAVTFSQTESFQADLTTLHFA